MKVIKKIFKLFVFIGFIVMLINYKEISNYIISNYIYNKNAIVEIAKGEYSKEIDYEFVQITNDFSAKNYEHLLNIIYTILDSGNNEYSFYCDDSYKECLDVINDLIVLEEEIKYIEEQLNLIETEVTKDLTDNKDKILAVHDYIINNTKYDKNRANNMNSQKFADSRTHTAYGLLSEKKSLCGGYSDLISIYIHRLNIKNIRISGNNHVWNLVELDGWKHLDATWDDPVTNTGEDMLLHDYFLITTDELRNTDEVEHQFNENIYVEAK